LLLGYLEFLALLFVPGLALFEIFRLGGGLSFSERLGLAFGLSMAIDVLALAFRTSGLLIGSQKMVGIFPGTLNLMLGASVVGFVAPVLLRRRLTFYVAPSRNDLYLLGLVVVQALLVVAHFSKYPVFPQFQSVDFSQHVQITSDLQAGRITLFPGGILYYGIHLLMGSAVALSGDLVLEATQYAIGILTALSPLLVFAAVCAVTRSRQVGLLAGFLYVATGFVWFGSVFDAGLYANFYGILSMLLLLALAPLALEGPRSPGVWVALALAVGSGYLSHYSYLTVVPAILALPVGMALRERKASLPALGVAAVVVLPGLIAAAARPEIVRLLIQFQQAQAGGNVTGDTFLSPAFAWWPVIRYVFVEVTNDAASLVFLALAVFGIYRAARSMEPRTWMVVVWLLALLFVAPFTEAAWRFSYVALVPLLVLAAIGLGAILPKAEDRSVRQRTKLRARRNDRNYRLGLLAVVTLLLVVNSWSWALLADAASNGGPTNQTQYGLLKAMGWMNSTLPAESRIVSVTDSDMNYYQLLYGRPSGYAPLAIPSQVAASPAEPGSPIYVVLTRVGTLTVTNASLNPFDLYPTDTRFHIEYNDSGILVFKLGS